MPKPPICVTILSWVELLLLIVLGIETFVYADPGQGTVKQSVQSDRVQHPSQDGLQDGEAFACYFG